MSHPLAVRYATAARQDLAKIADDLAEARGGEFAAQYVESLQRRIETLSTSPKRYRVRRRLGDGLRLRPEAPYHVFYRVEPDHVLIVRILHGRRRATRRTIEQEP